MHAILSGPVLISPNSLTLFSYHKILAISSKCGESASQFCHSGCSLSLIAVVEKWPEMNTVWKGILRMVFWVHGKYTLKYVFILSWYTESRFSIRSFCGLLTKNSDNPRVEAALRLIK